MDSNDWHAQWQLHAYNFKDGRARIDFQSLGLASKRSLELLPGPGFGDYSHPTTRLVCKMMHAHVENRIVLDVGCGSGILSLAAVAFGARESYGIDIDREAIIHARENARLNGLQELCRFGPLAEFHPKESPILLMNMIRSEQKEALPRNISFEQAFTSGILESEREVYLALLAEWGYRCLKIEEYDGWLGFHSKRN